MLIDKIISGGQTGADRAGLDFAIENGIPHGGWVPKGRRSEDGRVPDRYNLQEMTSSQYPPRTEKNIRESDGTLIVTMKPNLTGGSALTEKLAKKHKKPCMHVAAGNLASVAQHGVVVRGWLDRHDIKTLNVAGSRESKEPGVHEATMILLRATLFPF